MPLSRLSAVLFGLAFTVMLPALTLAQQHGARQFTLATGIAWTGDRKYRSLLAPTIDATYGWRVAAKGGFAAVVGGYGGVSLGLPTGDDCRPNGNGGCQVHLPMMGYIGAQVGGLIRFRRAALALWSGPGLFFVHSGSTSRYVLDNTNQSGRVDYSNSKQFGVLTRAEIMQRVTARFGLVLSSDVRVVNNVLGERVVAKGGSFGFRVQ